MVVSKLQVELRGVDGHGAIGEDGRFGDFAFFHELVEVVEQELCAPYGKGRDDDQSAAVKGLSNGAGHFFFGLNNR